MFEIKLSFYHHISSGLNALDFRRQFNLPDGVKFYLATNTTHDVDEAFARIHFGPEQVLDEISVPITALLPGEITQTAERLDVKITDERARELYIAGKIDKLKRIIDQLEKQVAELESQE